jgi:hypothetical protein
MILNLILSGEFTEQFFREKMNADGRVDSSGLTGDFKDKFDTDRVYSVCPRSRPNRRMEF